MKILVFVLQNLCLAEICNCFLLYYFLFHISYQSVQQWQTNPLKYTAEQMSLNLGYKLSPNLWR